MHRQLGFFLLLLLGGGPYARQPIEVYRQRPGGAGSRGDGDARAGRVFRFLQDKLPVPTAGLFGAIMGFEPGLRSKVRASSQRKCVVPYTQNLSGAAPPSTHAVKSLFVV